jgi:hypothetical protein
MRVPVKDAVGDVYTEKLGAALEKAQILTLGDIAGMSKYNRRLTDLEGVGPATADKIEDALAKFWIAHPEYQKREDTGKPAPANPAPVDVRPEPAELVSYLNGLSDPLQAKYGRHVADFSRGARQDSVDGTSLDYSGIDPELRELIRADIASILLQAKFGDDTAGKPAAAPEPPQQQAGVPEATSWRGTALSKILDGRPLVDCENNQLTTVGALDEYLRGNGNLEKIGSARVGAKIKKAMAAFLQEQKADGYSELWTK